MSAPTSSSQLLTLASSELSFVDTLAALLEIGKIVFLTIDRVSRNESATFCAW
jgi:hypothetical protein